MSKSTSTLTINNKKYTFDYTDLPRDITLLTFIREYAGLLGTKFMCLEGGCGSCTVVVKVLHPVTQRYRSYAANACLILLNTMDNMEITTIQGIGDKRIGYHPIQTRLAQLNGTQCGYCSPGFVMNMFGLLQSNKTGLTQQQIENSFGGNICRCTGYRSILDSMKSFARDTDHEFIDIPIPDIEDLGDRKKSCPLRKVNNNNLSDDSAIWDFPLNLNELFQVLNQVNHNQNYMLVAGGTSHGVYRRSDDISLFIDVNKIPELHIYEKTDQYIKFGGNISITETLEHLLEAAETPGFEYCREIYNHYNLVAHVQVRNIGTLAGNLMIKHQHNEFPSDIYITLEAANAQLSIMERPESIVNISPLTFLNTNMNKKVLAYITLLPYPKEFYFFKSYKVLPIAQNAKAYVNAGFLFQVHDTKSSDPLVSSARICFGGINPKFTHATQTENYLVGRNLYQNESIKDVLYSELNPDWVLPDTSPDYRKMLACSLFYKFLLSNAPTLKINQAYYSGANILNRPLSSGTQTFQTFPENYPLTQPVPKIEALAQTSGEATYCNDIPNLPSEAFAAFVTATSVNSTVAQIDPSEALIIPGVIAFYSAKDIPGKNSFVNTDYIVLYFIDEPIFLPLNEEVRYYDQPVGIIVAETKEIAEKATKFVKVMYEHITNKPIAPTVKEKIKIDPELSNLVDQPLEKFSKLALEEMFRTTSSVGENFVLPEIEEDRKNPSYSNSKPEGIDLQDLSFDNIDLDLKNFDGYLYLGGQYHFTMEPQTTVCIPNEDGIFVYSSSQWMELTQVTIARMLKLPQHAIQVEVRRVGGAYGAKISRNCQISCATGLACYLLNRPVRFIQTIESMMRSLGKRCGLQNFYTGTVNSAGKIVHLLSNYVSDSGWVINETPIHLFLTKLTRSCYSASILNWQLLGKPIVTDAPSNTWMRGPGSLEAVSMIENIMEHAARVSNNDPVDVRYVHIADDHKMKTLLPDFIKSVDYRNRKLVINNFNKNNRWIKKGISLSLMQYDILYFLSYPVTVAIYEDDGTVAITHGGIEMGQGINTKVAQTAAHILKIPLNKVKVFPSNTISGANAIVSGASVASESVCFATKKACETLLTRLLPVRVTLPLAPWEKLIKAAHLLSINLISSDQSSMLELKGYSVYGLVCTEVEVDILTGNHIISKVDILEDTGESLSPLIDVGQIEGAFITGIGYFTSEKLVYNSQTGQLVTDRTWTYKVPQAKDIPVNFNIRLLQNSKNSSGVLRSKATGEPAICLSISVLFAMRMALDSARKDAGLHDIWFHMGAPFTPEDVVLNSGTKISMLKLK